MQRLLSFSFFVGVKFTIGSTHMVGIGINAKMGLGLQFGFGVWASGWD